MRFVLIVAFMTLCLSTAAFAETNETLLEFEGRYWMPDLTGAASVTANSITGTDIDLEDDLGMSDEDLPEGRFAWHLTPNHTLRFAYTGVEFSGDKNVEKTITFDGKTYTVGTNVQSDVDVKYFRLGWAWQFINLFEEAVKIGTLVDVKGLMLEAALDAPALAISESEDFFGALPTVGAIVDVDLFEKVSLFAEISGLAAGDYGYFFDAEFGAKFKPINNFSIVAGYRIFDMKFEDDPDYAELKLAGPFFGGTFNF